MPVIDVTDEAKKLISPNVVKAERKDNNVLVLIDLGEANGVTADPKYRTAHWQLHYRWLSNPESLTNVQGSENTYHGRRTIAKCVRKTNPISLFDAFQLF